MGLIDSLLKRKSVPEEKVESSLQMLKRLKNKRDSETGKYLSLMIDESEIPPPNAPSTLQDLDERARPDTGVYSPPMTAVVFQDRQFTALGPDAKSSDFADPIKAGINLFFDEFARQASAHNQANANPELSIGIARPEYGQEKYPEGNGQPVLRGTLHTVHWALYFFGYGGNVDIYLLPYDESHPLSFQEVHSDGWNAFMKVTTRQGAEALEWCAADKRFTRDHIPRLAQELLSDLVRAASGE